MGDCHGASYTGLFIHKSQSLSEAATFNARLTASSALWTCVVTFDLPPFAGPTAISLRPHRIDLRYYEEVGLRIGLRDGIGDGIIESRFKNCVEKLVKQR